MKLKRVRIDEVIKLARSLIFPYNYKNQRVLDLIFASDTLRNVYMLLIFKIPK